MSEVERKKYDEYYHHQAGSGLPGFSGYKYQRGSGFFGNIFRNILKPLGIYLGKQALSTGVNIGTDYLAGEDMKTSVRKRGRESAQKIADDGYKKITQKISQAGSGRRKRRRKSRVIKTRINRKIKMNKITKRRKRRQRKSPNFGKLFQ